MLVHWSLGKLVAFARPKRWPSKGWKEPVVKGMHIVMVLWCAHCYTYRPNFIYRYSKIDNLWLLPPASEVWDKVMFLPPATKLGQGNIFSSMCQEFCPQVVGKYLGRYTSPCTQGGVPGQEHPPGKVHLPWTGTHQSGTPPRYTPWGSTPPG